MTQSTGRAHKAIETQVLSYTTTTIGKIIITPLKDIAPGELIFAVYGQQYWCDPQHPLTHVVQYVGWGEGEYCGLLLQYFCTGVLYPISYCTLFNYDEL